MSETANILKHWGLSARDLTRIVMENSSLRGMLLGYVAEHKLTKLLSSMSGVTPSDKPDDHDRTQKGDRFVVYRGRPFSIESKSLQSATVRRDGDRWTGKAQVDASDNREVKLRDGSTLKPTCLLVGEFDVLAVNLFAFEDKWRFVFARNADLPRSSFARYTPQQQEQLLATTVSVSWPPCPPFYGELRPLLDAMVEEASLDGAKPSSAFSRRRENRSDSCAHGPASSVG